MTTGDAEQIVVAAFERDLRRIAFDQIAPLYVVTPQTKETVKFKRIVASIAEIGLVEPIVVTRDQQDPTQYTLLDGHLRLEVLKGQGATDTPCIISTDDEAFTYNNRISRLATIQEHKMILRALTLGASEERLAKALNVNIKTLQDKRRLLDGICPEAAEMLKDKQVALTGFRILKKMKPMRQIEAAQLMVTMNKYTVNYAQSLLAGTPESQLVSDATPKKIKGISREQLDLMERESANLEREVRLVEDSYGTDHLDLVLARGYVTRLVSNERITKYLALNHEGFLPEFEKITEREAFAS
ncbi:chromosome partitioning protein ParB [Loktanella sp. D2R18]|uniref:plasmid partitioning protein RepB C-terminal domain-containing protein n=1 Tax=Rhodobacterales TaxID=204455 RepID=UPI000DE9C0C4|nr:MULTISPECIES: plasmid partitioning protein RepB C-terminal domain-containing protein [Rhodobacterales]MDO6590523.1 plasmid partitioning protein RepB C-terminal domain-containing protein [Yoonia sp. 1_MG-2023]RBW41241.1 chromosome partitioning protein ParB [Loktanella sp. D2R18]